MSEEKYIAIGTIDLQSSEIGKDINAKFGSIDENFKQIIEGEYLKGASGRDINIACCKFSYDPKSTNINQPTPLKPELYINGISQPLTDTSIGQIIYEVIEDEFKSEVSDTLGAVGEVNWYDNLNTTNEIYLVYETDAITGKNTVISSLPYIHIDARFTGDNLSLVDKFQNRNLVDTSCNIIFSNNQFQVVQSSPTLYFNDILDEFCWKINGQETDLIARGPKGESFDTNSKLTCIQLEDKTIIIDDVEYYKAYAILADYYDGSNPEQPQKYGFVTDIDANILPNPLGVPVYGIFGRETDQMSYFFSSMFNMNIEENGENYTQVSVDKKDEESVQSVWVVAKDSVLTLEGGMLKEGLYYALKNNFAKDYKEFCGDQKVGMLLLPQNFEGTKVHAIYNGNIANNGKDFQTTKDIINISPLQFGDEISTISGQKLNIDYDTTIKNLNAENIISSSLQTQSAEVDKINAVNIDASEINIGTIINTPEINVGEINIGTIINTPEINVGVITNTRTTPNDITLHLELGSADIDPKFIPGFKIDCTKYYDGDKSITKDIFTIGNGGSKGAFFTPEFNFNGNINTETINVGRGLNVNQDLNAQDLNARNIECDGLTTTDLIVSNVAENTQRMQISVDIREDKDAPVTKDLVQKLEQNLYIPEPIIQIIDRDKIINDSNYSNWKTAVYKNGEDSYPILAIGSSAAHGGQISYTQIGEAMDNQLMLVHFGFGAEMVTTNTGKYPAKLTRKYADIALLLRTLEQFINDVCSGIELNKSNYLKWILEKSTEIYTANDYI